MSSKIDIKNLNSAECVHFLALTFDYWDKFPNLSDMIEAEFGAGILSEIDCVCNPSLNFDHVFRHKNRAATFVISDIRTEYRLIREGKKKIDSNIRSAMIEAVGRVISKKSRRNDDPAIASATNKPVGQHEEIEYARKKLSAQHVDDIVNPSNWSEYLGEVNAESALDDVITIMKDRAKQYDNPKGERSMDKVVEAFNIITGHQLSTSDGYMLMSLLKLVRSQNSSRPDALVDSVKDNIAYGALYAETLVNERKEESK